MSDIATTKEEEQRYEELQNMALDFARSGNTQELEKMIEHGLSVNLSTLKDDSLIMLASYNGNIQTVEMLIKHKANMDKINQRGQTPLEGVCFKGNLEIVQLLVNAGAKVNNKAFIYASMFGNKDVFSYLKSLKKEKKSNLFFSFLVFITGFIRNIIRGKKASLK